MEKNWRIALRASALRCTWKDSEMSNYRRFRVAGGTYFFTVNLLERRRDLLVRHIDALRAAVRATKQDRPFHIDAWVVLPDHMHTIWTLPEGDEDFSNKWKSIKTRFSQTLPPTERRSAVRVRKGERGIWQRRFWEHVIRDERDATHFDYIHFNPVKHGWADKVVDWPFSSFHRYLRSGIYDANWAGAKLDQMDVGEPR
jgi:putative transposase